MVALRCVSFDTSLTLEELLAVIALGEIEVMAPLLRKVAQVCCSYFVAVAIL